MSRTLMSGNEAAARGAWEAGVAVGVGYPGTPSTELLENLARYEGVRCEWAPNEKVAAEVAAGVSFGGRRALVTTKHVGLNVAADPLLTQAYIGVGGGLVYFVADDPGMHSSQNEQDTRSFADFAKVPVLEPSSSAETLEFVREAFDISERFDTPVIVRSATRISHSKGLIDACGERTEHSMAPTRDTAKWVMIPAYARVRRVDLERRMKEIAAYAEVFPGTTLEMRDTSLGVIASGVVYQYVREALPDASILKLGMTVPIPRELILEFSSKVDRLAVIEELDPYLTREVRALGVPVAEVDLPRFGELSVSAIRKAFGGADVPVRAPVPGLPGRPPLLCAGCPHRGVFHALGRMKAYVLGDIGCYTLGALPPLSAMDTCVCMGAGVGMAHGLALAGSADRPVVAVIGDSTFAHSGLTGVLHMAYNGGTGTVVVLDNRTTAMTGRQGNPLNAVKLSGGTGPEIDLGELGHALGAGAVRFVDPNDFGETLAVLREETAAEHLSIVVAQSPCVLLTRETHDPYAIDEELCTDCGLCLRLGCPAISRAEGGKPGIDISVCVGCGQCPQVCRYDAIVVTGAACDFGGAR